MKLNVDDNIQYKPSGATESKENPTFSPVESTEVNAEIVDTKTSREDKDRVNDNSVVVDEDTPGDTFCASEK